MDVIVRRRQSGVGVEVPDIRGKDFWLAMDLALYALHQKLRPKALEKLKVRTFMLAAEGVRVTDRGRNGAELLFYVDQNNAGLLEQYEKDRFADCSFLADFFRSARWRDVSLGIEKVLAKEKPSSFQREVCRTLSMLV